MRMHNWFRLAMLVGLPALVMLAGGTPAANAAVMVQLSSPSDLTHLTVGQTVEIDVRLSGLAVGSDFIFNLNTKVLFPSSLFAPIPDPTSSSGLTATVTPGSVFFNFVDGPLQVANFNAQSSLAGGAATGIFSESPNVNSGAIGLNGLYYSFLLQATAPGSGTIQFDPTPGANQYAADDTGFNFAPLPTGAPLSFNITPAAPPAAVPEPTSLALLAVGGLGLAGWRRWRKRKAA
jgi:PEP-CTERM motif